MARSAVGAGAKERDPGEECEEENRHGREPKLQGSGALVFGRGVRQRDQIGC